MKQQNYILKADGLSKAFYDGEKTTVIFEDISFSIQKREMIAIMGCSGSGKSVLLNALGGITPLSAGTIDIKGTVVTDMAGKQIQRTMGYSFQIDNLMPWRTVRKNLKLPLEINKMKSTTNADDRVMQMLQLVGLEAYADVFPHELSGGMRQRVGFARALMHDPEILLLDQPFGALDAITRAMMGYQLLKIIKGMDKSGVLVTNDFREATLLASKVLFLSPEGRVAKVVEVDIPYHERDEHIEKRPGYKDFVLHLRSVFDLLCCKEKEGIA